MKIILDFTSKDKIDFDFVCTTRFYKHTLVNFIKIEFKGCRDKKTLAEIIENSTNLRELETTLNKYGYRLILKKRVMPNINYLYLIKNTHKSLILYGNKNMLDYVYKDEEIDDENVFDMDQCYKEIDNIKNNMFDDLD